MKYVLIFSIGLFVGVGLFTLAFKFFQNPEAQATWQQVVDYKDQRSAPKQQELVIDENVDYNKVIGELTGSMGGATSSLNSAVEAAEEDLQSFAGQLRNILKSFENIMGQVEKDAEPVRQNLEELSKNLESALTPQSAP